MNLGFFEFAEDLGGGFARGFGFSCVDGVAAGGFDQAGPGELFGLEAEQAEAEIGDALGGVEGLFESG
ncbi:MAG: hypothetical protein LAT64_06890 [Phycisphaerales bacterium]|nr:hypothetical protein [Phycisphaerales bacterium]